MPRAPRRRRHIDHEKGNSWTMPSIDPPPSKKIVALKAGQVVPAGAQYLTYALKDDVPHLFFLVDKQERKASKAPIGFRLGEAK